MYVESGFVTVVGLSALTVLRRFERKDDNVLHRKLSLVITRASLSLSDILTELGNLGVAVSQTEYEKDRGRDRVSVSFHLRCPADVRPDSLIGALENHEGVERARIETLP